MGLDELRESVDLIARRDDKWVAVEVKRRDQLHGINPLAVAIKQNLPKWRYDLVVYPPDGIDEIPLEDGEPDQHYVDSLLKEAQEFLDSGKLACVLSHDMGRGRIRHENVSSA